MTRLWTSCARPRSAPARSHAAILFAGGVQLTKRFDGAYLTLSADRAAEARGAYAELVFRTH